MQSACFSFSNTFKAISFNFCSSLFFTNNGKSDAPSADNVCVSPCLIANIFIYKEGMGHSLGMTLYYWIVTTLILLGGLRLFGKCKKHFADVL